MKLNYNCEFYKDILTKSKDELILLKEQETKKNPKFPYQKTLQKNVILISYEMIYRLEL